MKHGTNLLR